MFVEINDNLENNYKETMKSYMPYLKKNQTKNKQIKLKTQWSHLQHIDTTREK